MLPLGEKRLASGRAGDEIEREPFAHGKHLNEGKGVSYTAVHYRSRARFSA
jgi:hypothetical protein